MRQLTVGSLILLFVTLAWGGLRGVIAADGPAAGTAMDVNPLVPATLAVVIMSLFLPLIALTYYFFRQNRQNSEFERILGALSLHFKDERTYWNAYLKETSGYYLLLAVAYATLVSCLGLTLLFLYGYFFEGSEFPTVFLGGADSGFEFPAHGTRLIAGMAFLGAYLWGVQYLFRRYMLNDLKSDVYYNLSMRMILATLVAVAIYNTYEAVAGGEGGGLTGKVWPFLAFMLGMFPQRGLNWLTERMPLISPEVSDSVRDTPLEMIEGIESQDKQRLRELGIDSCYDLAVVDFVPLILNTPYGARQLIDWIMQAKLCVYCSDGMKDLRPLGIRTILDLETLEKGDFEKLSQDTAVTESALKRAQRALQESREIERLRRIGESLGQFTKDDNPVEPARPQDG